MYCVTSRTTEADALNAQTRSREESIVVQMLDVHV